MNKKLIIISVIILISILGLFFIVPNAKGMGLLKKKEPVYCAMDVKECPDGSFVSRVPPECSFAKCKEE